MSRGDRLLHRGPVRSVAIMLALLVTYYAVPVGRLDSNLATVASALGMVAGMVAIALLAMAQIRQHTQAGDTPNVRLQSLIALVYLAVVMFATGYFIMATSAEGQMSGLDTKTDALYFTMTTLGTVGYGDVHATGQLARALVTLQIAFNLVVVGALAATFSNQLRQRSEQSDTG